MPCRWLLCLHPCPSSEDAALGLLAKADTSSCGAAGLMVLVPWARREGSFPQECPGRAAAGTASGRVSALGGREWCYSPGDAALVSCPDSTTSGPEDLLPTPALPGTPPSPHIHSSQGDSLSSPAATGLPCRGVWGCQDKTAKPQQDLQSQGRSKAHPDAQAAMPSGALS